ncbi:helix-turn-helix transcriptional regulator [Isoptericola sp. b408]|uniref:ArsR/SmtB family transcription factor n=1 Tax=Isoptericola sp. b408 TaxID=3064653 RepID=UPI002713C365|nr:helix-turn-helix transcriptional regulator [Isoptericola sp. b408]MDO8152638.1 helix-turn-helix transcriptional regulator [Isoptericola sp. b408]
MASRTSSPLVHPDAADFDLFTVMSALSDPTRLGIVIMLSNDPGLNCGGFYRDVTPSVLTRHFRVLREAGVIRQEDVGNQRVNTLRRDELDRRFPGLLDLVIKEGADRAAPFPGLSLP